MSRCSSSVEEFRLPSCGHFHTRVYFSLPALRWLLFGSLLNLKYHPREPNVLRQFTRPLSDPNPPGPLPSLGNNALAPEGLSHRPAIPTVREHFLAGGSHG